MEITEEKTEEEKDKEKEKEVKKLKKENKVLKALVKAESNFFKDFKTFISKGNILQLAIAFIMGAAFTAVVNSLVGDIIMQFFSLIFGKASFEDLTWVIGGTPIFYGKFLMAILNFILVAFCLFLILRIAVNAEKGIKKLRKNEPPPPPPPPAEKVEDILKDIRTLLKEQKGEDK